MIDNMRESEKRILALNVYWKSWNVIIRQTFSNFSYFINGFADDKQSLLDINIFFISENVLGPKFLLNTKKNNLDDT